MIDSLEDEVVEGPTVTDGRSVELELEGTSVEEELEVMVGSTDEVEEDVGAEVDEELEDDVDEAGAPQPPTMEGTASAPFPIATTLEPQLAALARRRFWLS